MSGHGYDSSFGGSACYLPTELDAVRPLRQKGPASEDAVRPPRQKGPATEYVSLLKGVQGDPRRDTSAALLANAEVGADPAKRYQLIANLGARMLDWRDPSASAPPSGVRTAPAGYSYLGQFLAHDLTFSAQRIPMAVTPGAGSAAWDNLREAPLRLETIYGGGPRQFPLGFVCPAHAPTAGRRADDRTHLRLGQICAAAPEGGRTKIADDLPRLACPALDGGAQRRGLRKPGKGASDVLIADPRNDSHAIISQLTVLFHRLHNRIADAVLCHRQASGAVDSMSVFDRARDATIWVYRTIIWNDYLRRMIDPAVFRRYAPDPADPHRPMRFLAAPRPGQLAVEFSHAAFRFGHAMVRSKYLLRKNREFSIRKIIEHSSLSHPENMPFDESWVIDWSAFFDDPRLCGPGQFGDGLFPPPNGQGAAVAARVASRPLSPSVVQMGPDATFLSDRPDVSGDYSVVPIQVIKSGRAIPPRGLATRDLARCFSMPMASVATVLAAMRRDPALKALIAQHDLLASRRARAKAVRAWLEAESHIAGIGPDVAFSKAELDFLSRDPPLYFFVLFEAERIGGGSRLGPVGSFIVAETLFAILADPPADGQSIAGPGAMALAAVKPSRGRRCTADYGWLLAPPPAISADLERAFGPNVPRTMFSLIAAL